MEKKKILLYYPANNQSIAMETSCRALVEAGHEIILLTICERGPFHEAMEKLGIKTFTKVFPKGSSWKYFLQNSRYLVKFSKEQKADIIWSHLQMTNFIAIISRPFLHASVLPFRHHDESTFFALYGEKFGLKRHRNELLFDKIINRFAKKIVVLSDHVKKTMVKYEKCKPGKIIVCPLIYDFSMYPIPVAARVQELRSKYSAQLLMIMVSRLIPTKQHIPVFEVLSRLVKEGLSVKVMVMDDGPLRDELTQYVVANGLEQHVFFIGHQPDVVNYMAASDLLMHPSLTEASNHVAKEMGMLKKAVAVCENVGDFDDYIVSDMNGFVLTRDNLKEDIEKTIRTAYAKPERLKEVGENLHKSVVSIFSDTPENRLRYIELTQIKI